MYDVPVCTGPGTGTGEGGGGSSPIAGAPAAPSRRLRASAACYLAAARSWAVRACDATRLIAGDDSPAYRVWADALAAGCWTEGAAVAPPDFARLWEEGIAAPPLAL